MNEKALEQLALEFLAAEYERDGKAGSAEHIRTQPLLPNKARAVRAIAAALRHQPAHAWRSQIGSELREGTALAFRAAEAYCYDAGAPNAAKNLRAAVAALIAERDALRARLERPASWDEEQRARELLAAEFERDGKFVTAGSLREGSTAAFDMAAIRVIAAALRQQPAPVDLEQFRLPVEAWKSHLDPNDDDESEAYDEADRLLSIIDNAGKSCPCGEPTCTESWEPGCGLGESIEHAVPAEREPPRGDELRTILAQQSAPVVPPLPGNWPDETVVEVAISRAQGVQHADEQECEPGRDCAGACKMREARS